MDSSDQNRLFFDDYKRIFRNSDFTVKQFVGRTNEHRRAGIDQAKLSAAYRSVQNRYANRHGFEYDSIRVVLQKDMQTFEVDETPHAR